MTVEEIERESGMEMNMGDLAAASMLVPDDMVRVFVARELQSR